MKEYHKIQTVWQRDPETRFKTLIEGAWATPEFEYLRDNLWRFTEKVDGTNIRVMWDGAVVTFGGKTDNAQIPAHLYNALAAMFPAEKMTSAFGEDPICLYGEGYGAKIQKGGGNYRPDQSFVLFDVRAGDWWLRRADVNDVSTKLGIDEVPLRGTGTLSDLVEIVRNGFRSRWGDFFAEGLVARPDVELFGRNGERIITKLKGKDFAAIGGKA